MYVFFFNNRQVKTDVMHDETKIIHKLKNKILQFAFLNLLFTSFCSRPSICNKSETEVLGTKQHLADCLWRKPNVTESPKEAKTSQLVYTLWQTQMPHPTRYIVIIIRYRTHIWAPSDPLSRTAMGYT